MNEVGLNATMSESDELAAVRQVLLQRAQEPGALLPILHDVQDALGYIPPHTVTTIAEGVNRASSDARSGAQAMSRVAGRSQDARSTAGDVKALAESLGAEAESLDGEVRRFLADVRAA